MVGVLSGSLGLSPNVHAAVASRGDPLVVLSNGVVLDLTADIADVSSDIKMITYVIQVPTGVSVADAISTDGSLAAKEKFAVNATAKSGIYAAQINLKTGAKNVPVTGTLSAGYGPQLGIAPAMVGLSSFTGTKSSVTQGTPPPSPLPQTVTADLATWIAGVTWSASTSAQGVTGVSVSLTL